MLAITVGALSFTAGPAMSMAANAAGAVSAQMATAAAGVAGGVVPTAAGAASAILVQGGSLRTWSYRSPAVEQVQVVLDGGPSA